MGNVEKRIPHTFISQDLYGFIDLLAIRDPDGLMGIQATSYNNASSRMKKIREHENFQLVSKFMILQVWGWRQVKGEWVCRVVDMRHEDNE